MNENKSNKYRKAYQKVGPGYAQGGGLYAVVPGSVLDAGNQEYEKYCVGQYIKAYIDGELYFSGEFAVKNIKANVSSVPFCQRSTQIDSPDEAIDRQLKETW
jgi:hypothetical protein